MKKRRPPKDIFAESHPDADMLMLKAVIGQLIVEIGSTRERPSEWVDKFIEEVRKQLDWGQIAARERGAAETEGF
jgi:hypothetical protein